MSTPQTLLLNHYRRTWGCPVRAVHLDRGPVDTLPEGFGVLEFRGCGPGGAMVYATCGMSAPGEPHAIELHLFAREPAAVHVETLTVVAAYHHAGSRLDLYHTVNLGRPWWTGSECDHALITLPYAYGPALERFADPEGRASRCLWLVPITKAERDFKARHGHEAIESLIESVDVLDPRRASAV